MRVLYVIDSLAPGGAETSLADMGSGLVAAGIDLHVMPLGARRDLAPVLRAGGVTVHEVPPGSTRSENVRNVAKVCAKTSPALVHTTLFEADIAGRIAAKRARIPCSSSLVNDAYGIEHAREAPLSRLPLAWALDAATAQAVRRFHALTEHVARTMARRLRIPARKMEVIPRGRRIADFPFRDRAARLAMRDALGINDSAPVVMTVGRHEPQKAQLDLIAAGNVLSRQFPDLVILVAGKAGRMTAALEAATRSSSCDVRLLGPRQDVPALLSAADIFCFPSVREGFGGALIEAMAAGCPIVASDIPTTREVLGDASLGSIFSPGDIPDMVDKLHWVLTDPRERETRIVSARDRFESRFTTAVVVPRMVEFFRQCVG